MLRLRAIFNSKFKMRSPAAESKLPVGSSARINGGDEMIEHLFVGLFDGEGCDEESDRIRAELLLQM